jgi:hypothetical protein
MKLSTEIFRRVYDDDRGSYIQVGPDADALDLVEIRTTNQLSREYFGDFRLVLHPEFAIALANAMIAAAQEAQRSVDGPAHV